MDKEIALKVRGVVKLQAIMLVDTINQYISLLEIYKKYHTNVTFIDFINYFIFNSFNYNNDNMKKIIDIYSNTSKQDPPPPSKKQDLFDFRYIQGKLQSKLYKKIVELQINYDTDYDSEYKRYNNVPSIDIKNVFTPTSSIFYDTEIIKNICMYKLYKSFQSEDRQYPPFTNSFYNDYSEYAGIDKYLIQTMGGWVINTDGTLSQISQEQWGLAAHTYLENNDEYKERYRTLTHKNVPYLDIKGKRWETYSNELIRKINRAYTTYQGDSTEQSELVELNIAAFYGQPGINYEQINELYNTLNPVEDSTGVVVPPKSIWKRMKNGVGSLFTRRGQMPYGYVPENNNWDPNTSTKGGSRRRHKQKKTRKQRKNRKQTRRH